jgi:hypothetical protein
MESESIQDILERVRGVHIGVDIGQKVDYTAIVVAEVGERVIERVRDWRGVQCDVTQATYRVHELVRLPLGTSFGTVAKEVASYAGAVWEMEKQLRLGGTLLEDERALGVDIFMDATGVGAPVVELISGELQSSSKTDRAVLHPITFTYGDRFDREKGSLGKAYLVSHLQVLFEQERLELPKGDPEIETMVEELRDYEIRIDQDANDKYGAFAVGAHDDMVTALGLACIEEPGYYGVEEAPHLWGGW